MPRPLAVRAAVVAASTTAAALAAVMPAISPAAAPAAPAPAAASAPVAALTVTVPITPVAFAVPSAVALRASALANALGKIGSPYRWGAAGPRAFDCSGLAYWAYKQVGVTLPRSSNAMSRVGTPVAKSQLQPGDLVFFYHPVSHVAIYVGNGQVVHASTAGKPVKIANLNSMPFTAARRI